MFRAIGLLLACAGAAGPAAAQQRAAEFDPVVKRPAFEPGEGPVVLVDAAHGNFHTIEGRYAAFATLLQRDGFVVRSADGPATRELLDQAAVYVISNAIKGGADAEWKLPTPPAFTVDEIESIRGWVEEGGSLMLIADHMPFPGATADLAAAFGFVFHNGFAMRSPDEGGVFTAMRSDGTLADHAITRGRDESERIASVMVFTGQAFRAVEPVEPLLLAPAGAEVWLPSEAWQFTDATPRISAAGLMQGAVRAYGKGRVAVFAEAAMFTAQQQGQGENARRMGMNHPDAKDNQQFALNVMHWLTGVLDGP
jgi:hypothetical protein